VPAQAAAPVLEKTAEQLAAEKAAIKAAEKASQREAARAQTEVAAPPQTVAVPANATAPSPAPQPKGALANVGWIVSMMLQALYVASVLLSGTSPLIWLFTGGVFLGNFFRRKTGWGNFLAAVVVSSAVAALVHGMKK
jgi:hypothetical protein